MKKNALCSFVVILLCVGIIGYLLYNSDSPKKDARGITPINSEKKSHNIKQFDLVAAIDLSDLNPQQKSIFLEITSDELCTCDCPKTLAGCLNKNTKCKSAVILANWLKDKIKRGVNKRLLQQIVSKEISSGFTKAKQNIDSKDWYSKGAINPEITIVEFADFQCFHCKKASEIVDELAKKYPNKIKVIFKHFPLPGHNMATMAAIAAEAAGEQGKFWQMHDIIYKNQNNISEASLLAHAKTIGLNINKFQKDINNKKIINKVEKSNQEALRLNLAGTPSFFINDRPYNLALTIDDFETRIAMEESRKTDSCY